MTTSVARSVFDFGRVVRRTFAVVGGNLATFAALAALLAGIPAMGWGLIALKVFAGGRFNPEGLGVGLGGGIGLGGLFWIVSIIAGYVLRAAIVHGSIAALNGRRASFGECLAKGLSHWFVLLLLAVVMSVSIGLGLVAFIVPGVIAGLAWSVAVPARVVEGTGVFGSLARSADLTRGRRWSILALIIVYFMAYLAVQQVLLGVFGGVMRGPMTVISPVLGWTLAVNTILSAISALITSVGLTSIYFELRSAKEGIGVEALASVFD
jgi:hypothetical protein